MAFEHVQAGEKFTAPRAFEWNAMLDAGAQAVAGKTGITGGELAGVSPQSCVVRVINKSGADRGRYECVQLGPPRWALAAKDNLGGIVLEGKAPAADQPCAVLLAPLKVDRIGMAVVWGPSILRMDTFAGSAKVAARPKTNGKFSTEDSGPIRLLQATSDEYGFGLVGVETAGSQLYLFTLTSGWSSGSATATIRNLADSTEIATGAALKDPLGHFAFTVSGQRGACVREGSNYYALGPYVTDVRWVDPKLEQSRDGSTYSTIDTAVDCS